MAWIVRVLVAAVAAFAIYRIVATDTSPVAPTDEKPAAQLEEETLGRFPRSQFYIEHDRFLPATDPPMLLAGEATFLRSDDEVFGVVVAGEPRAYPITMISYHHVVNDVIQGIPVAITY